MDLFICGHCMFLHSSVIEEITGKTRTVTIPCEVTQMERPGHEAVNITQGPNVNQTCGSNPELDRYVFGHDHSTLRVNCLEPGDEGLYRCRDGMEYCPLITSRLKLWEIGYEAKFMIDWFH